MINRHMKRWNEEELNLLTENYYQLSKEEMSKLLPGRGWKSIKHKARCIRKNIINTSGEYIDAKHEIWSEEEDNILKKGYHFLPREQILHLLPGRSWMAIRRRVCLIDLTRKWYWTEKEINILKENFYDKPKEEILELIPGKNWHSISAKAQRLNLKRKDFWGFKK